MTVDRKFLLAIDAEAETDPLYEGVGLLKDFSVKLHIDDSVPPVAKPHRRIPINLREKVEEKLRQLEKDDIIENVDGPTPWVSQPVFPPKSSDPTDIRMCVDMRSANKAILRTRHITPTIEEIVSDLNGAVKFSKLDLNQGYHQLLLDEDSRYITTFTPHIGLWRYKRLNFGICCVSEIFQNAIRQTLGGIPGVLNVSDDILVYGKSPEEHDNNLKQVLSRLREKGLTLNKKKCAFSQDNLGYIFSKEGMSPNPDKVSVLNDASAPSNPTEVRSPLGMANYCSRFIPNYATITEPMRELMKKDTEWHWEKPQEDAFNLLKQSLREDTVTQNYDPKKITEIIVDASLVGLGAILVQDTKDERFVISYASRALTPVEQRYSQTEREALAVVFGCERYHLYVMGSRFTVVTDHKPLVSIYNNPQSNPPARIKRWTLRLQRYDMTVVYRPGKDNPADYLSRHPDPHPKAYRAEME